MCNKQRLDAQMNELKSKFSACNVPIDKKGIQFYMNNI